MEPPGGNADLRTEAELAAIGELAGCIVHDDGAVDFGEEAVGHVLVRRDDGIGMARGMARDVGERFVEPVDHGNRKDRLEIFGIPVVVGGGRNARVDGARAGIAAQLAPGVEQRLDQAVGVIGIGRVDQQGFHRAANAGAAHLGIEHDRLGHRRIGRGMDERVV